MIKSILKILSYRKDVIEKNLASSFTQWTPKKRDDTRYGFYQNLAEVILSQAHGAQTYPIEYIGIEQLEKAAQNHGAVILLGSHYSCWEATGKMITPHLVPLKQYVAFKPIKNKKVENYITKMRSDTVATPISMTKLYKTILSNKKQGIPSAYYLIADQYPSSLQNLRPVSFFGKETLFINGPEKIASKLKVPIFFLDIRVNVEGESHQQVDIVSVYQPGKDFEEDITKNNAQALEKQIRRDPQYWLWSHKRWKNLG